MSTATMVHEVLEATVRAWGPQPALRVKRYGGWRTTTWTAYGRAVRTAARALIALGVERGSGVAIIGGNGPEWLIADIAAIYAGGLPAGIYTTSSAEQVRYITDHCEARVAFADTPAQVAKFVAERQGMPRLGTVVQMLGTPEVAEVDGLSILGWDQFLAQAERVPEVDLNDRLRQQKPDEACTLIYTSGTTGTPKAVMMTHTNLVWTAGTLVRTFRIGQPEVSISYLPLSHIAEQLLTVHAPMASGSIVYFAESLDKLGENLGEVRPTVFLGVPRVWEKIQAKMVAAGTSAPPARKKLVAWARRVGLAGGYAQQKHEPVSLQYRIADQLVYKKVRARLGLDRARLCITSAAPISKDTLEFFLSLGVTILEVYGMSECAGPATFSMPGDYRTGSCGKAIPGTEIEIAEDGEICMRGPHVFKGYLKDPEGTANALDEDGWLHSGDIGTLDAEGYLRITDRKKDLLITAGGENIAPQAIEAQLKSIPVVAQAIVIGDRRKYLSALLTLDPERLVAEAEAAGSPARTPTELAQCTRFREHLSVQIEGVNARLARVQTIKKFSIVPTEFSIDGGELTPTMKVKRKVVGEKYRREIDAMYEPE